MLKILDAVFGPLSKGPLGFTVNAAFMLDLVFGEVLHRPTTLLWETRTCNVDSTAFGRVRASHVGDTRAFGTPEEAE